MVTKRTLGLLAGLMLAATSLAGQRSHIAIDTVVARKTAEWAIDWTPLKGRGLCVKTHYVGADSTLVWVQDSVVAKTDSVCAPGQGVIAMLAPEWLRAGPEVTVKAMAQMARASGLPWLCGVAGLRNIMIGKQWVLMPQEWCAYEDNPEVLKDIWRS